MRSTPPYLPLLLWLKSRLLWRTYTRNTSAAVGAVLLVLAFGPMSLLLALGSAVGFQLLDPAARGHLLRGVMLLLYAQWLLAPLFGYALTEDYDIGKLLLYPLHPRQLLAGVIAGSVLDFGFFFLLPTLVVVLISFSPDPLTLLLVALIALTFLFHTIAASQALSFAGAGIARSRRGREIMMLLVSLVSVGFYAFSQLGPHAARNYDWSHFAAQVVASTPWKVLGLLPPGLAAQAISAASQGRLLVALGLLGLLLLLAAASLALVSRLVYLVYTGEVITAPGRRRSPRVPRAAPRAGAGPVLRSLGGAGRLPPVVEAVLGKELRYLYREPFFKLALLQVAYAVVVALIMARPMGRGLPDLFGGGLVWFLTLLVLFMESQVVFNIFGMEGAAATTLFLYPGSRRHLLVGKNLVYGAIFALVNLLVGLLFVTVVGTPELTLPLIVWLELALLLFLAVGNVSSILFPYRVAMRGWRLDGKSASRNWAHTVAHLLFGIAALVLLLPVLAAVLLPAFWISAVWFALTLPLALAYTLGLYLLSLHLSEKLLLARELHLAEQLSRKE